MKFTIIILKNVLYVLNKVLNTVLSHVSNVMGNRGAKADWNYSQRLVKRQALLRVSETNEVPISSHI